MKKTFQVHILAADSPFYEGPCESLIVPTGQGQYGILAGHCNTIAALIPGTLKYRIPGQNERTAAVSAGLMKIEDQDVLVLVDSAERPEEIDLNRAKREAEAAKEALLQKKSMQEYRLTRASLARAINRLQVREQYDLELRNR